MSSIAVPAVKLPSSIVGGAGGQRARYLKDAIARWVVWIGGLGVIAALMLIFFYLVTEVAPLFAAPDFTPRTSFALPGDSSPTMYLAAEEQGEVGLRITGSGEIDFFDLHAGTPGVVAQVAQDRTAVVGVNEANADRSVLAAQLASGAVAMLSANYRVSYPNDRRVITPELTFPYGNSPLPFLSRAARSFAVREDGGRLLFAGVDANNVVHLKLHEKSESLLGDSNLEVTAEHALTPPLSADILLIEPQLSWLYVMDRAAGKIAFYRMHDGQPPELVQVAQVGAGIAAAAYLAGGISVVLAQTDGALSQWFPTRNDVGEWKLTRVREISGKQDAVPITAIGTEQRRRSFAVGDGAGHLTMYYATSARRILDEKISDSAIERLSFNSRANYLMAQDHAGVLHGYDVANPHPEVSLASLWSKIWYESYDQPRWLWQSSSASADFEPKFSFTPLAFGTLKGAFYAMAFAVPIAILAAIFTANFMSPKLRQVVKPTVELLAALPTVILGFLAGLWLAPLVEANLPGVFLILLLLPLSIPLFGYLWSNLPVRLRQYVPPGWEAALLVPVVITVVWLCFVVAKPLEVAFFGGDLQSWLDHEFGIAYDQRNALVVGIAMGVAVIPTVFSIAEDAIFGVPNQLSLGSLALGATPWQTLIGVVLPTASPGIFSAVMIGFGRAIGETMIVLMATGNTPVTSASVFSGMRTLAANIAVEMPESEVASTHFRLLFLAGLVLFLFTFFFNTLAEIVRQRLRVKYSSI